MKKYNHIIAFLIFIILIVLGVLIYAKYFDDKIIFTLFGDKEIILYEGENYLEYGYVAINQDGENLNNKVKVKSNLDINKVGEYTIEYSVKTKLKTYHNERKIRVLEDTLKDIEFKLKGSNIVNIEVGREYVDPRFVCINKVTNEDLSNYVMTTKNVDTNEPGIYKITYYLRYQGKEKKLTRKVYVLDEKNTYSLNTTLLTNKPVTVNFKSNIYNFSHVVCPNETTKNTSNFTYNFFENGEYKFYVFDTLNNYDEVVIKINNIDKIAPTGKCSALLANGKTTYNVTSKDTDISNYIYNDDIKNISKDSNYVVSMYNRDAKVALTDLAGNKNLINCNIERKYLEPVDYIEKNNIKYSSSSDSLKINIMEKDGYFLTHIWAKDPYLQIKKEMLESDNKKLMLPKKILEQAIEKYDLYDKIIWSSNASAPVYKGTYYDNIYKKNSNYNLKEPSSLLVYNGKIIFNDYKEYPASTVIYYVNASNQLRYIPVVESKSVSERKEIFQNALDGGINNTFAFNAVLVKDKRVQKVTNDYYALRNGFCQLDENNFLSVVSDTRRWNKDDFAKFMGSLGCVTAVNFDGGGSNALFYKEKNDITINTLTGNGRALSSVIYLTELD